jgi:hypothetical protein
MQNYPQATIDQNFVNCKNNINALAKAVYPVLVERLKRGYKLKDNGDFFKKDQDITQLVKDVACKFDTNYKETGHAIYNVRVYFIYGMIRLDIKGKYRTSDVSCDYINKSFNIQEVSDLSFYDLKIREAASVEELTAKRHRLDELREQEREICAEISRLKFELNC